jgi:hypothetical protein
MLKNPPTAELEKKLADADDQTRHRLILDRVVELTDPEALHLHRATDA